jgi:Fe-S-cluster containining protein
VARPDATNLLPLAAWYMNPGQLCQALASTTDADYDCRRCGACCLSAVGADGHVLLEPAEADRLRRLGLPIVPDPDGASRLATQPYDGPGGAAACIAFEGAPGFPCACTVYEDRPDRCRQFEMGSAACRAARLRAGLPL